MNKYDEQKLKDILQKCRVQFEYHMTVDDLSTLLVQTRKLRESKGRPFYTYWNNEWMDCKNSFAFALSYHNFVDIDASGFFQVIIMFDNIWHDYERALKNDGQT